MREILDQALRLPADQRRQLVADLQANLVLRPPADEDRQKKAMKRWLARAGTGHADNSEISSHKNEHLAEIYATKP